MHYINENLLNCHENNVLMIFKKMFFMQNLISHFFFFTFDFCVKYNLDTLL